MEKLQTIQKTFGVFQKLSKAAKILCVVGAVTLGVLASCTLTQSRGGNVFSLVGEPLKLFPEGTDLLQKSVELFAGVFMLTAQAILFGFSEGYLKAEQADKTPFTESGAQRLKRLGIRFIYIPIVAIAASQVVAVCFGTEVVSGLDNFGSVVTGIVLLLASMIFRYGAELEQAKTNEPSPVNEKGE